MDKDGDGKISYQEYLTVMAKLGTHHNAMQSFVEDIADQHFIISGKVARSLFLDMDHETRKSWRGKLGELVDGTKMGLSIMGLIVLDFIAVLGEVFIFLTEVTVCSYKCDGLKPIRLYDSKFKNGGLDLAHECSKDTSEMDAAQLAQHWDDTSLCRTFYDGGDNICIGGGFLTDPEWVSESSGSSGSSAGSSSGSASSSSGSASDSASGSTSDARRRLAGGTTVPPPDFSMAATECGNFTGLHCHLVCETDPTQYVLSHQALHWISVSILALLMLHILLQMIAYGLAFWKKLVYVLDFLIVLIALVFENIPSTILPGGGAAGLFIFLLFWRAVRIMHAMFTAVEFHEHEKSHAKHAGDGHGGGHGHGHGSPNNKTLAKQLTQKIQHH